MAAEAVMAAAAIRCLGGDILARVAPADEKEKKQVVKAHSAAILDQQLCADELAPGDNVIFCATGISNACILRGVHVEGRYATTSSVVMRTRYRTVRRIRATHDLVKKTIRLRSAGAEASL